MQSRRDQVEARADQLARLTSALMSGTPEYAESPTKRDTTGMVVGALAATVTIAVFAALGLFLGPREAEWRTDGAMIVDQGTGSRYVYLDGVLHPVLNVASVRLLTGSQPQPYIVRSSALADVARGPAIGIEGFPDNLPTVERLNEGTWLACPASTAEGAAATSLSIGVSDEPAIGEDEAVLVSLSGQRYLLWRGTRLLLSGPAAALLGYVEAEPLPVTRGLLATLPEGPALAPVDLADLGASGPTIAGEPTRIGDLFQVIGEGGVTTTYLVLADGLLALSPLEAMLRRMVPAGPQVSTLGAAELTAAPTSGQSYRADGPLPVSVPSLVEHTTCVQYPSTVPGRELDLVSAALPAVVVPAEVAEPVAVQVAPGGGALVQGDGGPVVLVTEEGRGHPVPDVSDLGYQEEQVLEIPPGLLALVPVVGGS